MAESVRLAKPVSLAGEEPPDAMQGMDFSGLIDGTENVKVWRDTVYFENLFLNALYGADQNPKVDAHQKNAHLIAQNKSYRCRGVRTDRWKYFIYYEHSPVIEELYDLKNDPREQTNLAGSAEHRDILNTLRGRTESMYRDAIK